MMMDRDVSPKPAGEMRCTRCGATWPQDPGTPDWMTFRWGCPRCARRRDLPDRPPRPTLEDPFPEVAG